MEWTCKNSDNNPILAHHIDPHNIANIKIGEATFNEMLVAILGVTF